jgi:5'-3' exonuclease
MGIPSFYRHLCRRFPALVNRGPGPAPEWLCLDFNCAMYHVLRSYSAEHPYSVSGEAQWEAGLCKAIAAYMEELVGLVKPTKGVYVSCDGVVCAAKRKQQRLRRFKGPWTSAAEAEVRRMAGGTVEDSERWDQNALTPGTAFMGQLGDVLTAAGRQIQSKTKGLTVTVSTTAEPGEGEHKLLRLMRSVRPATCTIYGLDADLILLAMLLRTETGADVRLLREAQEFETGRKPNRHINTGSAGDFERAKEGEWRNLHVTKLIEVLLPPDKVRDYVATMTLLGNDFLPRSLTQTVRDDGIPKLIAVLKREVWDHGLVIVGTDGRIQRAGLLALVSAWAATEEGDMLAAAQEAVKVAGRPTGIGENAADTALRAWNALPAQWATLTRILAPCRTRLVPDWRRIYRETWRAGDATSYVAGVGWTWDYYAGKPVDLGWHFHEHLPPLWSDVATLLCSSTDATVAPPPLTHTEALPEWLHLLSVLPADSVRRLLPPDRHKLMTEAPYYWPSSWSLFDVGRSQMWECEPVIPVIPEAVLRPLI